LIVVVMGVTGAGKTTVGSLLAAQLGWEFADADNFHPAANVEKMSRGIPLTDADRAPWLAAMRSAIEFWISDKKNAVLACSALKRCYRDELLISSEVRLVYLRGSYETIARQLRARHGHFATEAILADQFATLEEPEDAIVIDVGKDPVSTVAEIRARLGLP
jgi:gluconokinase